MLLFEPGCLKGSTDGVQLCPWFKEANPIQKRLGEKVQRLCYILDWSGSVVTVWRKYGECGEICTFMYT